MSREKEDLDSSNGNPVEQDEPQKAEASSSSEPGDNGDTGAGENASGQDWDNPSGEDTSSAGMAGEKATPDPGIEALLHNMMEKGKAEYESLQQRYARLSADFDNFRKRTLREKEELKLQASAGLIEELLPVLDTLELGLKTAEKHPEAQAVSEGFRMVGAQFVRVLQDQGLEEMVSDGADFDPNLHECLTEQPSQDVEQGKVLTTFKKGFFLHGKLIRAAQVVVSSGPEQPES